MPGVCSYGFFSFFRTRKKAYYHRKNRTQNSWIPCEFPPSLSPTPKRGGGELNVGLTRLPLPPSPYPRFFVFIFLLPPRKGCAFFYPVDNGFSPAWHPIKKMVWNLFKRWRWDRRFGLRIKLKHRSFRSEPHRFFSVGVRHIFSLRRELQEKTNTGLKDSYTYPDKNTCAFAQHPCHPM